MTTPGFRLQMDTPEWRAALRDLEMDVMLKAAMMLEQVGWETISYLRSLTKVMRPAVRSGENLRPAHPGGWADVTGILANSYWFEVQDRGQPIRWMAPPADNPDGPLLPMAMMGTLAGLTVTGPLRLVLINSADYAAALEAKAGYFVLTGVTEAGGPVEGAIRRAANALGLIIV